MQLNKSYINTNYICTWNDGKPISPDYISRHFTKLLKQNQLPEVRFHDLLHTVATALSNNKGVNLKAVQEFLGHSDIGVTQLYLHPDFAQKQIVGKVMNRVLTASK